MSHTLLTAELTAELTANSLKKCVSVVVKPLTTCDSSLEVFVFLFFQGLLLNFNPEVFSALRVSSMSQCCDEPESSLSAADGAQSDQPCSTQSSDCRSTTSVSTEELELSALLSGSSSAADTSLHSASPSPVHHLLLEARTEGCSGASESEALGAGQQEEAYVTMSSFYQVK